MKGTPKKPIPDIISPEIVFFLGGKLPAPLNILYWLTYLTAGRITEVLPLCKRNFELVEYKGKIDFMQGQRALYVTLPNRKSRRRKFKVVPIPLSGGKISGESDVVGAIRAYLDSLKNPDAPLFPPMSSALVRFYFKKIEFTAPGRTDREFVATREWRMHPHYLRHCRTAHLLKHYNLAEAYVVELLGWTDGRQLQRYKGEKAGDLWEKMVT